MPLVRRAAAEFVGTMFLVIAIVGSGVAATTIAPDITWLPTLSMSLAAGATLAAMILAMQSISADFNPAVTLVGAALGAVNAATAAIMVVAQFLGGFLGVILANLMFTPSAIVSSTTHRDGGKQFLGEVIATLGLVLVVYCVVRAGRSAQVAWAVGAYLMAAWWFTCSGSFANPAVTLSRSFTNTVSGIHGGNVGWFILAEIVGALIAFGLIKLLYPLMGADAVDERPGEPRQEPAKSAAKKAAK